MGVFFCFDDCLVVTAPSILKKVSVSFIFNLKQENDFNQDLEKDDRVDYNKVFDYMIDIPPVNVDNYDSILRGLLEEKKIDKSVIDSLDTNDILNTKGMRYLIYGHNLSIREIKNRLNTALTRYEFLKLNSKEAGSVKPRFECCAVASYLMNEYSDIFNQITEEEFGNIVRNWQNGLVDNSYFFNNQTYNYSEAFVEDIMKFLEERSIDADFRMYYYNFPKKSIIYTLDEKLVVNALLYNDCKDSNLENTINKVAEKNSCIIRNTYITIKNLPRKLPTMVFEYEMLFETAFLSDYEYFEKSLTEYCNNEIKSAEVSRILNFDLFKKENETLEIIEMRNKFLEIIANKLKTEELFLIRKNLIQSNDVMKNKRLFYMPGPIIQMSELESIQSIDVLAELIDIDNSQFTEELFKSFHDRLINSEKEGYTPKQLLLYEKVNDISDLDNVNNYYIEFMKKFKTIIGFMELSLPKGVNDYVKDYIEIVNSIDSSNLKDSTLEMIKDQQIYNNLNENVCQELLKRGYILEYILNMGNINIQKIDLKDKSIYETIKSERAIIIKSELFTKLRKQVIIKKLTKEYGWLFDADCPALTKEELDNRNITQMLNLINLKTIKKDNYETFSEYFNSKNRNPQNTYLIIKFISKLSDNISYSLFYSLDMEKIEYKNMSKENMMNSLNLLKGKLKLKNYTNALEFMEFTSCLYTELEKIVSPFLDNKVNYNKYDNAIRGFKKLTSQTIENIKKSSNLRVYNREIEDEFFKNKLYRNYIYSKVMRENRFEIERDKLDILYKYYIDILNDPNLEEARELMGENTEFLLMIVQNESLNDIDDAHLLSFASLKQNYTLLRRAFVLDDDFVESYFTHILGFDSKEAAEYYVKMVTDGNHADILENEKIYANIYQKIDRSDIERKIY